MILNSGRHTQPDPQSCSVRSLGGAKGMIFFSSGLADHALRLGPYMRRSGSQKHLYMDTVGLMQNGKSSQQTAQEHQNKRRPANPPARFAFRQKANSKPKSERGKSTTETTTQQICQRHSGKVPLCHKSKTCRNELIATQ